MASLLKLQAQAVGSAATLKQRMVSRGQLLVVAATPSKSPAPATRKPKTPAPAAEAPAPKKAAPAPAPAAAAPAKAKRVKKEKVGPKRALGAYMIFCKAKRDEVKTAKPELKATEVVSKLGEMWRGLSADDKKPYEELAAKDKERYEQEKAALAPQA